MHSFYAFAYVNNWFIIIIIIIIIPSEFFNIKLADGVLLKFQRQKVTSSFPDSSLADFNYIIVWRSPIVLLFLRHPVLLLFLWWLYQGWQLQLL